MANLHAYLDIEFAKDTTGRDVRFGLKRAEADESVDTDVARAVGLEGTIADGATLAVNLNGITTVTVLFLEASRTVTLRITNGGTDRDIPLSTVIGTRTRKVYLEGMSATAISIINSAGAAATYSLGLMGS